MRAALAGDVQYFEVDQPVQLLPDPSMLQANTWRPEGGLGDPATSAPLRRRRSLLASKAAASWG